METKRVLIATALCLVILLGWTQLSEYMGWTPPPPTQAEIDAYHAQQQAQAEIETIPAAPIVPSAAVFAPQDGRDIKIESPLYSATINSSGAILTSYTLKNYSAELGKDKAVEMIPKEAGLVSPMGILYSGMPTWYDAQWSTEAQDVTLNSHEEATLEFFGLVHGVHFKRSLTFSADTYLISEQLEIISEKSTLARLSFTLATATLENPENSYDTMKVVYDSNGLEEENDIDDLTKEGLLVSGQFPWAGIASNYFLVAVAPVTTKPATLKARIQANVWRLALEESDIMLHANTPHRMQTYWWFGPKERDMLEAAPQNLAVSVDLGFFDILARPMLWLLNFINQFVNNWGVAIIIITILIKIVFLPLTKSSFTSMEKMKRIQPMVKELQTKYANDKEAMSRETMQLYKTYGVNPLGGCLPILIQIPVFFALYQVLLLSLDLRHSSFITYLPFTDIIWLADLAAKDPLYITPIIMGATMFLQQYLSPSMGDPTQRRIMLIMPVIFTFMFLNFPSGLVLYWLMSNVLSILQQWYILRKIKN